MSKKFNRNDFIDYYNNNVLPSIKRTFSKQGMTNLWSNSYMMGIIMIVLGLLLILVPLYVSGSIGLIAGLILVAYGIVSFVNSVNDNGKGRGKEFQVIKSVVIALLGVYYIIFPLALMNTITVLIGIFFLVDGFIKVRGMLMVPARRNISWWITFVLAAVVAAMGLFVIFYPFKGTEALMIIFGVFLCISGVSKLFEVWRKRHVFY